MKTVFIVGFMAAGKSTLGKKLSKSLALPFIDLDDEVSARLNQELGANRLSLSQAIEKVGLDRFREVESMVLKNVLGKAAVISTGGGTPCYFDNLSIMKSSGIIVYLATDRNTILGRLRKSDKSARPLISNLKDEELKEFIDKTLNERLPFYTQAHITYNPARLDMEELVQKIKEL